MNEKGFTLLELLIAISLLIIIMTPFYATILESIDIDFQAQDQSEASLLAQKYIEDFKETPLNEYINSPNTNTISGGYRYTTTSDTFKVVMDFKLSEINNSAYSDNVEIGDPIIPDTFDHTFVIDNDGISDYIIFDDFQEFDGTTQEELNELIVDNSTSKYRDNDNSDGVKYEINLDYINGEWATYLFYNIIDEDTRDEQYVQGIISTNSETYNYRIIVNDIQDYFHIDFINHSDANVNFYLFNNLVFVKEITEDDETVFDKLFTTSAKPYNGDIKVTRNLYFPHISNSENNFYHYDIIARVYKSTDGNDVLVKTIESSAVKFDDGN